MIAVRFLFKAHLLTSLREPQLRVAVEAEQLERHVRRPEAVHGAEAAAGGHPLLALATSDRFFLLYHLLERDHKKNGFNSVGGCWPFLAWVAPFSQFHKDGFHKDGHRRNC